MSQDAFEVLADRLMELGVPEVAKLVRGASQGRTCLSSEARQETCK